MEATLLTLKERTKKTVLRKIEKGEVTFDADKKIFVYKDTEEEYKTEGKGDNDNESSEDEESSGKEEDDIKMQEDDIEPIADV